MTAAFAKAAGKTAGKGKAGATGIAGLWKRQYDAGSRWLDKAGDKVAAKLPGAAGKAVGSAAGKTAIKAIPLVGNVAAAGCAVESFADGDILGGVLNSVAAVPGPVGWVGALGSLAWEAFGDHDGIGVWDPPDGSSTHILPGSAGDIGGVADADVQLTAAQHQLFGFPDGPHGTVWNSNAPAAFRLDTPAVTKSLDAWLAPIASTFDSVKSSLQSSGEPYMAEYLSRLQPHLDVMAQLPTAGKQLVKQLAATSDAASTAYDSWKSANTALRQQLSSDGELRDSSPVDSAASTVQSAENAISDAAQRISALAPATVPALAAAAAPRADHNGDTKPDTKPASSATTAPAPVAPARDAGKSDLDKLLSGLHGPSTPAMPAMGGPHGGGTPLGGGSPLGGGRGGTPLSPGSEHGEHTGHKLADDKAETKPKLSAAKPDNASPTPAATPAGATHGGATPGTGTPGTGKPGGPPAPETKVDMKGTKVKFPDAKTAKMAQLLAAADPTHPMSLADAAAAAGLTPPVPGHDPGQQIQPAQAKPGDILVSGDNRYMLLGDGKFYDLQKYTVIGSSDLPADAGSRGGYFHLPDPAAGSAAAAAGGSPVSGPAGGIGVGVPGGTPTPTVPTDAGAPAAAPVVPSAGSPGVPAAGGGPGPTSAAATATGTGQALPSAKTPKLDPGAVK